MSPSPSLTPATARALALTMTVTLLRVGLVVVLLTDYVITIEAATRGAPSLRFGRPLRGLLVLFIDRAVQHCIQAVRRRMHTPALHPCSAPLLCTLALGSSTDCRLGPCPRRPPRRRRRATTALSHGRSC